MIDKGQILFSIVYTPPVEESVFQSLVYIGHNLR